jgi:Holliday junction DNA helicase RuvA
MISWLQGEILDRDGPSLTLRTGGQDGGIGYQVMVPDRPGYLDLQVGRRATLHIYTHVREDALDLFGFSSREEKRMFLLLLSVSGIGPKGAISVLTGLSSEDLISAILAKDLAALTSVPGIGKKTAERILLELGDTVRKRVEAGEFGASQVAKNAPARGAAKGAGALDPVSSAAREALLGLGFKETQADQMLERVLIARGGPADRVEDLLREALRGGHA